MHRVSHSFIHISTLKGSICTGGLADFLHFLLPTRGALRNLSNTAVKGHEKADARGRQGVEMGRSKGSVRKEARARGRLEEILWNEDV